MAIVAALCVHVADSAYCGVGYLGRLGAQRNLVSVTRAPDNGVFYRQYAGASIECDCWAAQPADAWEV